ncbi:MAG: hypothetical protein WCE30_15000 [Mycobacterium sp.]
MTVGSRLLVLFATAVAVVAVVACHSPAAHAERPELGMSVSLVGADDAEIQRQFDLLSTMNVKMVRFDFDWSRIEGVKGTFDWSFTDRMVRAASTHSMKVLALLTYSPSWARPSGTGSHVPPTDVADYATFARVAAQRYSPLGVDRWEIWNEPNIGDFWQPKPNIDQYGALFRAAAAALRDVDPRATVLTGGLTRGTTTKDRSRIAQTEFIDGLYANGSAQLASAIAIHPYSFPVLPAVGGPEAAGRFADLPAVHAVMDHWGDGGKKIWATEFGAPTGTDDEAMSEADQAKSIAQAEQMVRAWNWMGPLIIFELRDHGTDRSDIEQNFGVLNNDLTPKEAGRALLDGQGGAADDH